MAQLSHLPHIKNVKSGIGLFDPNHSSIFEVYIMLPQALKVNGFTPEDEVLLTQQVTNVSGLDVLQKTPDAGSQKFFGVDVSYSNPVLDNTYAEITINFNLNLRNDTDNFILRIFKAWALLNYDLSDGSRTAKRNYISDGMRIAEANRNGVIWRSYRFNHVILKSMSNIDSLDYTQNEARQLTVVFRSDYWDEDLGGTQGTDKSGKWGNGSSPITNDATLSNLRKLSTPEDFDKATNQTTTNQTT